MDGWASRGGGAGVGNLARKPAKPSSSGRKLTIKPFKGASAPPPRDATRDLAASPRVAPPRLAHAPGAHQIPPASLRPTLTIPSISILPPGPRAEKPKLPSDFEETAWTALAAAVDAVHARAPVGTSLESLYRLVENLCLHGYGDAAYAKLRAKLAARVADAVANLRARTAPDPVLFLAHVDACWSDHCESSRTVRSIFLRLDRARVARGGARGVWDLTLWLFRRGLEGEDPTADLDRADEHRVAERAGAGSNLGGGDGGNRDPISTRDDAAAAVPPASSLPSDVVAKTVRGVLAVIAKERDGEAIDRARVRRLLRMFSSLGLYARHFERAFLDASAAHYRAEGDARVVADDASEYLRHCETRLAEEEERAEAYLDPSTRRALRAVTETELVERHVSRVLDEGFEGMLRDDRREDLRRLHRLLSRVGAGGRLRDAFAAATRREGAAVVKDEENDKDMVRRLLEMKRRADVVVAESFAGEEAFASALKESFESFVNCRQNRPAELIAKFIDAKLRAGGKSTDDSETESALDAALVLFRYIQGKDVFEAFYKKDLAKRLLLGKSASVDAEKSMISRLKAECGSQFTTKLEGMFKDVDLSRDVMRNFDADKRAGKLRDADGNPVDVESVSGVELSVVVLTAGCWPTYAPAEVKLPRELDAVQATFRDFYLAKHGGRRLVWQNGLAHCVVRARFPKCGAKELSVSLFQAVVCLLFNDAESLTFEEIKSATGVEDKELRRTLQSLACGKVRVLTKEPKGRDVEDGDVFRVNEGFNEKLYRVKVNSIQMKETAEENKATNERVFQDRQYQIDAAIVRVMKTRKTLSHQLLVGELLAQIKFPAKPTDLKRRVESLIEREYLERDRNNPQVYNYLA